MIRIVAEGGVYFPRVFCDYCGQPILKASNGNLLYEVGEDGLPVTGEFVNTHKQCNHAFEHFHPVPGRWYWMDLTEFPVFLVRNMEMDFKKQARFIDERGRL